jgi:ATP-dependent DNA ligase
VTTTAQSTSLPRYYAPALCRPVSSLPTQASSYWLEPKLDGIRVQIVARNGEVHVYSRSGQVYDGRLPEIEAALTLMDVVLDGEVVWFDPETDQPDFHKGSGLFRREDSARSQQYEGLLTVMAFDLLEVAGQDVRKMPIETRRGLLAQLVEGLGVATLRLVEQGEATPERQTEFIARYREGVVLKKKGSTYVAGRAPTWLKIKVVADADVVITGFERGNGKYANTLGCVVFGQFRNGVLTNRGTCSGMSDAERDHIWTHQDEYLGQVLVIRHMGSDGEGFRHPQYDHLRGDAEGKTVEECVWE